MDRRGAVPQRARPEATDLLEAHRAGLTGHCYRMLGSASDAEDAVQETLLRAWRAFEGLRERSALSGWLYRIATHICLDRLRAKARRELPESVGPSGTPEDELVARPAARWLEPIPDARCVPPEADPERQAELRQHVRLAFVAALQRLPPRQRAALLLKDVVGFSAAEIAETLGTSPAATHSALQRARRTLAERPPPESSTLPLSKGQRDLVERYVDAFHRYDVDDLVALLQEDATLSMPPLTLWLRGRPAIADWLGGRGAECQGSRLVPTAACGTVAFGQYRRGDGGHRAWSLLVLDPGPDRVRSIVHFLEVETLFPLFGLSLRV